MTDHGTKRKALFLCTIAIAALAGCAKATHEHAKPALRIAIEAMPTQLDPRYAMDASSSRIDGLVFASLAITDRHGDYVPYLARSWQQEGQRSYLFELRRDFLFHNGRPLTAADVVATYQALMDPALASPRRAVLSDIASVSSPSAYQVLFQLRVPDGAFFEAATIAILPAELARRPVIPSERLIGAGPYRIAHLCEGERVRLEAFRGFAGGVAPIPAISFEVVPDAVMRAMQLRHGSIDLVQNAIDPDAVAWLAQNERGVAMLQGPYNSFEYLGMNFSHPALADLRVRRAIASAIDREAIVKHILNGQARVATGLLPPHHWAYSGAVRRYPYRPERARQLLDRAGLTDPDGEGPEPRLVLSYKTTTQQLRRRIAEVLADNLARVGIRLEISSYEWGTFYSDIRHGSFHLYTLAWVGITDPDIYRRVFHSRMIPPAGNNRGRYSDRRMDHLTERGREETDKEKRRHIYARVQRRAARRLPYIPLWWPDNVVVVSKRLSDFKPHPSGDLLGLLEARLVAE